MRLEGNKWGVEPEPLIPWSNSSGRSMRVYQRPCEAWQAAGDLA